MKSKYLLLLCLFVIGLSGYRKESTKIFQIQPEKIPTQSSAVLYVNNFKDILGDPVKEDSLLEWCRFQGFTEINLNNIGPILRSDNSVKAQLNDFVGKAHSIMYGLKVNFVAASSTGVNNIGTYCANYSNRPDGITTEYEFWNNNENKLPNSFDTFKTIVDTMTIVHNTYPSISRNAYVSQFKDKKNPNRSKESIIRYLIKNCETIFLVNYHKNAYDLSETLKNKLQYIANEAKRLDKVANIVILFNVNQKSDDPDIYKYFSSGQKFVDAYNHLIGDYSKAAITSKAWLKLKGYAIFRYTDAKMARPHPGRML